MALRKSLIELLRNKVGVAPDHLDAAVELRALIKRRIRAEWRGGTRTWFRA
ncbi:hypothetical protein [Streptomyces lasiicapitis]|uniref:Uncharacterized protein n=1 Tax=Streptomyces lasiicapitis TaxID=1923961 RepID=A0ABQ2MY44_9ACTN|nr:hypothetical protein [Streptomyces lasiicapitis]GGO58118.1 hypothetical protein GCM10012286_76540 [Streptomyces lasiicapitis]